MASLRKNTASQHISFVLVNSSTGAALTGATFTSKAWVAKDGSQAGFGGTFTELGNGQYDYSPTQAETNCTSFGLAVNPTSSIPINLQVFTDNWDTTAAVLTSGSGAAQIAVNGSGAISTTVAVTNAVTVGTVNSTASNFKKNTIFDISFPMTDSTTHLPKTGLTVTANRSIDGGAFGACANAVTEIGSGFYNITLAATDTNGNAIVYLFTAATADDRGLEVITQP